MEIVEMYKKEIEEYLTTLSIYKGEKIINKDKQLNAENFRFIKRMFIRMKSGNVDEKLLDKAINELLPYLYEKD